MSRDILNEMILEQLEPKLRELLGIEEPLDMLQEKGPAPTAQAQTQTKAPEGEKVGVFKKGEDEKPKAEKGFLDVSAIVSTIVATTEASGKADKEQAQGVEKAFFIIRDSIGGLGKGTQTAQSINNYLVSFFQPPKNQKENCTDIPTLASRALVNSAYSTILTSYNAKSAGFVNEGFLANLMGGKTLSQTDEITGASAGISNIADFVVGDTMISLKTKSVTAQAGGSLNNLLATLGIPFVTKSKVRGGFKYAYSNNTVRRDVFYVFFAKPGPEVQDYSIGTAQVTREKMQEYLESAGIKPLSKDLLLNDNKEVGEVHIPEEGKRKLLQNNLTQEKYYNLIDQNLKVGDYILGLTAKKIGQHPEGADIKIGGVSDLAYQAISFKKGEEASQQNAKQLEGQLTYSLNRLNQFFKNIEETVLTYAASPSIRNLTALKEEAKSISSAAVQEIDLAFTCPEKSE